MKATNNLRRVTTIALAVLLMASVSACAKRKKNQAADEGEVTAEVSGDAGTDAVPAEGAETAASGESVDSLVSDGATPPAATGETPAAPVADAAAPAAATTASTDAPAATEPTASAPAPAPAPAAPVVAKEAPAEGSAGFDGSGQYEQYTVQTGDTLMKIAYEHYGNLYFWKQVYEANKDKIQNPNAIPKGTVLKVEKSSARSPASGEQVGEKVKIKQGDTLGTIANEVYGSPSKWKRLWEQNKTLIRDPNKIFAGFYLYYTLTAEEQAALASKSDRQPASAAPAAPAPAPVAPVQAAPAPVAPAAGSAQ